MSKVFEALVDIQARLNVPKTEAPKDRKAKYKFRSLEQINAAVKPLAFEHQCAVLYSDEFTEDGRCISTCTLLDAEDRGLSAKAECYVERNPQFMSKEQACGAASSYARKYAACGLFALDSGEDPDHESDYSMSRGVAAKGQQAEAHANDSSKQRLWLAIQRYADARGENPYDILDSCKSNEKWRDDPDYYEMKAAEFEAMCDG